MKHIRSVDPMELPQPKRHAYLLAAVAPRPIAFVSTIDQAGNVNLSPFSFFNVFSSNPPIMVFSPARSGRDASPKHTHLNIEEVPEVVINVVNYAMVEQTSLSSTAYPRGVNEFVKAGFTAVPSHKVRPPRVAESPVAFECTVEQVVPLGQDRGAGNLVICRVVMMHAREEYLDSGLPDVPRLDLVGRMGGNWYARASGQALFEVAKPLQSLGIGVDQLPAAVRHSRILTGNELGKLGNLPHLPSDQAVAAARLQPEAAALYQQYAGQPRQLEEAIHRLAQAYLEAGKNEEALALLLGLHARA